MINTTLYPIMDFASYPKQHLPHLKHHLETFLVRLNHAGHPRYLCEDVDMIMTRFAEEQRAEPAYLALKYFHGKLSETFTFKNMQQQYGIDVDEAGYYHKIHQSHYSGVLSSCGIAGWASLAELFLTGVGVAAWVLNNVHRKLWVKEMIQEISLILDKPVV